MSAEFELDENTKQKWNHQRYLNEKKRGIHMMRIKPATMTKLKEYYDEYCMTCQQNHYPVVDKQEFIVQFCELGFFAWRDRNKGK